jgi:hypothetical protein
MAIVASLAFASTPARASPPPRAGAPSASTASSKPCGVASDEAVFEAPGVQVYFKQLGFNKRAGYRRQSLIACVLPARTRVVGTVDEFSSKQVKEQEASEGYTVNGLIEGRYLWVTLGRSSPDAVFSEEQLLDLQAGRSVAEPAGGGLASPGELPPEATVVAPGELVFFEGPELPESNMLLARFTAGKGRKTLDSGEKIQALAASEHEIYWMNGSTVKSAAVPAPIPATTSTQAAGTSAATSIATTPNPAGADLRPAASIEIAAAARKTKTKPGAKKTKDSAAKRRCEAPGTRTLYRAQSRLRVLRKPEGQVFGCSDTVGKLFALEGLLPDVTASGPPVDIELVSAPFSGVTLNYEFPAQTPAGAVTALVVADPSTGMVISSALAPAGVTDWTYGPPGGSSGVIVYTDGSTLTVVSSSGSRQIETGTISELAVTPATPEGRGPFELYWTNAGVPKAYAINAKSG